jgi:hypothetical protein
VWIFQSLLWSEPGVEVAGSVDGEHRFAWIKSDRAGDLNRGVLRRYRVNKRGIARKLDRLRHADLFTERLAISLSHHHEIAAVDRPLREELADPAWKWPNAGALAHHLASKELRERYEEDEGDKVIERWIKELFAEDDSIADEGAITLGEAPQRWESK